jgi:hypothetical protein
LSSTLNVEEPLSELLTGIYTDTTFKTISLNEATYSNFNVRRYFANNFAAISNIFDNKISTYYTSSTGTSSCFIGYDFGPEILVEAKKLTFEIRVDRTMVDYLGMKFQGSNDNSTWTDLFEVTYFTQNLWVHPEQNTPQ